MKSCSKYEKQKNSPIAIIKLFIMCNMPAKNVDDKRLVLVLLD